MFKINVNLQPQTKILGSFTLLFFPFPPQPYSMLSEKRLYTHKVVK